MSRPRKLPFVAQIRLRAQMEMARDFLDVLRFIAEHPERAREILDSLFPAERQEQRNGLRLVKPVDPLETASRDLGQPAQREQALPADPAAALALIAKLESLGRQGHEREPQHPRLCSVQRADEPGLPNDPRGAV